MKLCSIEAEIMRKDKRWIRVETIKFIMKRDLILIENKNGINVMNIKMNATLLLHLILTPKMTTL